MNRKHFVSSLLAAGVTLPHWSRLAGSEDPGRIIRIPPYLKTGDTIGITCPAGWISPEEIQPSVQQMENWGFTIRVGKTVGERDFGFGGTDDDRAADFQEMLDDPGVKAIMCARGGYGSVRIIDRIDFTRFKANPKWIIGFSDITVIHCHLNRNYGIASLHSKMCNSFPDDPALAEPVQEQCIQSIGQALKGGKINYVEAPNANNRNGTGSGELVGGNLKTIETLAGSPSDLYTAGKILFVEDTGEYLYSIDRMFWSLKRSGKLSQLAGLVVGGFRIKPDDPGEEFGRTIEEIVLEKVKDYPYPVCFDFPVGHQKNNFALKCGVKHRLEVGEREVVLREIT